MPVLWCCKRLKADEQLRIQKGSGTKVYNGPGVQWFYFPSWCKECKVVKAEQLGPTEYMRIRNTTTCAERIEKGPMLVFLGASDVPLFKDEAIQCANTEFMRVENIMSGAVTIQRGPCTWFPTEHEKGVKGSALICGESEYVRAWNSLTGGAAIYRGPCIWFPSSQELGEKEQCITLTSTQYIIVMDRHGGHKHTVPGPCCWCPEAHEIADGVIRSGWSLQMNEYVRLLDHISGEIRCVSGEQVVFPNPEEKLLDGRVLTARLLKEYDCCDILDESTGEVRTLRGPGQYCLGPYDRILREENEIEQPHLQCGDVHLLCGVVKGPGVSLNANHPATPRQPARQLSPRPRSPGTSPFSSPSSATSLAAQTRQLRQAGPNEAAQARRPRSGSPQGPKPTVSFDTGSNGFRKAPPQQLQQSFPSYGGPGSPWSSPPNQLQQSSPSYNGPGGPWSPTPQELQQSPPSYDGPSGLGRAPPKQLHQSSPYYNGPGGPWSPTPQELQQSLPSYDGPVGPGRPPSPQMQQSNRPGTLQGGAATARGRPGERRPVEPIRTSPSSK